MIAMDSACAVFWNADGSSDPRHPNMGERWLGASADGDVDVSNEYRAHRLALGITEGVAELGSEQTLWLEANAVELNGVSFNKGCYVGQENTARMNWRQKVNRRLVIVPLEQADLSRQRCAYPELGLSVELRRVEDMTTLQLPEWQRAAIT
jgi:folate-binding protein YgfZ